MRNQQHSEENIHTNGKAVGSLVIGVLAVIGFFLIGEGTMIYVLGLFLGIIALQEIKIHKQNGIKMAWWGIVLNCIGVLRLLF